jgi:hypothetical protein
MMTDTVGSKQSEKAFWVPLQNIYVSTIQCIAYTYVRTATVCLY